MLTNTFCHIAGIGEKIERALWSAGVTSWDCAAPQACAKLPRAIFEAWARHMEESIGNHANRNPSYFCERLQPSQRWRMYPEFRDSCAFLDIETTGLTIYDEITTIVLTDDQKIRCYVNGDNLCDFPADVNDYQLLVTYNGSTFDIPFIKRYFQIPLAQGHIDLRYPLRSLGLGGGLKACELAVGISRPGMENIDGFVAVLLWQEYRTSKNPKALETLLAYNIQDTLALRELMVHVYNHKLKATPFFSSHSLTSFASPKTQFQVDIETIERVLSRRFTDFDYADSTNPPANRGHGDFFRFCKNIVGSSGR